MQRNSNTKSNYASAPIYHAYLVVTLDVSGVVPCVHDVGIYSESAGSLTTLAGHARSDVLSSAGPSYQEAQDALKRMIKEYDHFKWAWPWVDDSSRQAYDERNNLKNYLRVAASMVGAQKT